MMVIAKKNSLELLNNVSLLLGQLLLSISTDLSATIKHSLL